MKKARNWIACLLLISGMITVFNSPLTDFLIESYRPVVQATSNSKTTPEDWSDVQLVNLFSVAKARVSHPEVHVIGAVYNENAPKYPNCQWRGQYDFLIMCWHIEAP